MSCLFERRQEPLRSAERSSRWIKAVRFHIISVSISLHLATVFLFVVHRFTDRKKYKGKLPDSNSTKPRLSLPSTPLEASPVSTSDGKRRREYITRSPSNSSASLEGSPDSDLINDLNQIPLQQLRKWLVEQGQPKDGKKQEVVLRVAALCKDMPAPFAFTQVCVFSFICFFFATLAVDFIDFIFFSQLASSLKAETLVTSPSPLPLPPPQQPLLPAAVEKKPTKRGGRRVGAGRKKKAAPPATNVSATPRQSLSEAVGLPSPRVRSPRLRSAPPRVNSSTSLSSAAGSTCISPYYLLTNSPHATVMQVPEPLPDVLSGDIDSFPFSQQSDFAGL